MTTDLLPMLQTLLMDGQQFIGTDKGLQSEARLQTFLKGHVANRVAQENHLASIISNREDFSTIGFIRLRDAREGNLWLSPLIYIDGDLSSQHPRLRIQLLLVAHSANQNNVEAMLLRFETPEGLDPAGGGDHDYYHSQLCRDLRGADGKTFGVPEIIPWFATSCPAWPLSAKSPWHLVACVVFTLYGKREGFRIIRQAYNDHDKLADQFSEMLFEFPDTAKKSAKPTVRRERSRRARRMRRRR